MEYVHFEAQVCNKISILKEKHVFDILIILCLMTSLQGLEPSLRSAEEMLCAFSLEDQE